MNISKSVLSDDIFFTIGISELLSKELIDEFYYIIDVDDSNLHLISKYSSSEKNVVAFINDALDYYALNYLDNVIFIDKKWTVNEIMSCLFVKGARNDYWKKNTLSERECEVLSYIQRGMQSSEISIMLGISTKTFYSHRRNLMSKLKLANRVIFYRNVAKFSKYKENLFKD
ncbi:LuxR C-terminal-related transcriptional regulator [Escherichia coli]|uniref:response regulator transcription factor n=1 Tax=Escherichia coli TaxID=562 RepID=UPI000BB8C4F4|nr:helix-turn-helix transcriptional regulator [Escherichia coli]EFN9100895.1 LuxR family transcriptional regulator [Escherichia coli]ELD1760595.1 helix-turn-helix transcriptional regulator [Escherichia coli]ELD1782756.1 helix-turn-helix transcriptional regulator [Escherichia coli]ELJ4030378.1 helix-turn-helix transcriptional regulator [Escherichia coli]KAB3436859.1 LuxR family transcriptional regulator [Escherichia coli]